MKRYRNNHGRSLWGERCYGGHRLGDISIGSTFVVLESSYDYRRILAGTQEGWIHVDADTLFRWQIKDK
jgi:hypothetical protein